MIMMLLFRFYDAMAGQTWLVNATYYGHGDVLDDYWADTVQVKQGIGYLKMNKSIMFCTFFMSVQNVFSDCPYKYNTKVHNNLYVFFPLLGPIQIEFVQNHDFKSLQRFYDTGQSA